MTTGFFNAEASNFAWILNFIGWFLLHSIYVGHWVLCLIQLPLQFINQLYAALLFWPKFYLHLFGPSSEGRSILAILWDPAGPPSSKKARDVLSRQPQFSRGGYVSLQPTLAKFNVFTSYQVSGAHAHLASPLNKQVCDSLAAGLDTKVVLPYFNDPFKLSIAYAYIAQRIIEPPDCFLQYLWSMGWHAFWASIYLLKGYCVLRYRMDSAYLAQLFGQDLPDISADMRVSCFTTGTDKAKANIISFDTDGIPFILDSGANCIVSNVRELFEDLQVVTCSIATHSGEDKRTRYVGVFTLQLPDDQGRIH
eukprot:scaffold20612_cov179-Skeletonema_dohrnii-CCMP3373.AAC.1